jgi:hypothetical protein
MLDTYRFQRQNNSLGICGKNLSICMFNKQQ